MSRPKPVPAISPMQFMAHQLINKQFFSNYKRNMVRKTTMFARKVNIDHMEKDDGYSSVIG